MTFQPYIEEVVKTPSVGVHRIGSTLAHPVAYAGYLVQAIPFCILAAIKTRSRTGRIFAIVTTCLAALALFLTYSKGSWIVALLMLLAGVIYLFRRWRHVALVVFIVIVLVLSGLVGLFWQQIHTEASVRTDTSVEYRMAAWRGAVAGIREHPLVGVGLGAGQNELLLRADPEWVKVSAGRMAVDNYYLNILLEEGLVGALLWLVVLGLIFREGLSLIRNHGAGYIWGLAAMASIVDILVNCLTFDALLLRPQQVLFWIAAGLIHGTMQGQTTNRRVATAKTQVAEV
ncbi:MAG: O-antigen ligase family protein [Thermoleophilia bacterium]